jgi:hypothetical protein
MCYKLSLDFELLKNLYFSCGKIFWNFVYSFFPGLSISLKKFNTIGVYADNILLKLTEVKDLQISNEEDYYFNSIKYFIKDKFECDNELYTIEDIIDYLYFNNTTADIILNNSKILTNASQDIILNYLKNIKIIKIKDKEFINMSEYGFKLKSKLEEGIENSQALKIVLNEIKEELENLPYVKEIK